MRRGPGSREPAHGKGFQSFVVVRGGFVGRDDSVQRCVGAVRHALLKHGEAVVPHPFRGCGRTGVVRVTYATADAAAESRVGDDERSVEVPVVVSEDPPARRNGVEFGRQLEHHFDGEFREPIRADVVRTFDYTQRPAVDEKGSLVGIKPCFRTQRTHDLVVAPRQTAFVLRRGQGRHRPRRVRQYALGIARGETVGEVQGPVVPAIALRHQPILIETKRHRAFLHVCARRRGLPAGGEPQPNLAKPVAVFVLQRESVLVVHLRRGELPLAQTDARHGHGVPRLEEIRVAVVVAHDVGLSVRVREEPRIFIPNYPRDPARVQRERHLGVPVPREPKVFDPAEMKHTCSYIPSRDGSVQRDDTGEHHDERQHGR